MARIRVVLVDDHPLVRTGIRNLLEREPDIVVVGEAGTGSEALKMVHELVPDLVVLDMNIPGLKGYEVAQCLKDEGLPVSILALSGYTDRIYIQEALANGVSGYISKNDAPDMIVEAVRGIMRGEHGWFSSGVTFQISSLLSDPEELEELLTPKELEVLKYLTESKTNHDIAQLMSVSEKTVEKHLVNLYLKLNVDSRVGAAVYAVRQGLFERLKDHIPSARRPDSW